MTHRTNDNAIKLDDFINPKSMITPGAAGGITMMITNTLASQFAGLPGNWTALTLSFMFGALTFMYGAALVSRVVYFVINSLIIFVMAQGSNALGMSTVRQASAGSTQIGAAASIDAGGANYSVAAAPSGQAAAPSAPTQGSGGRDGAQVAQQSTDKKDSGFFKPWGWSGDKKP
jgi:large-conductance mechanosensitive channel